MLGLTNRLRATAIAALAAFSIASFAAPVVSAAGPTAAAATSVATTATKTTAAKNVVKIALAQRHRAYRRGSMGPRAFDCSGLVRFAYKKAGVSSRLGGGHSGYAMYHWALTHHKFSRSKPQVGDVVVYGRGSHVGIYIGHGRVISALNPRQGIRVTGVHALRQSVTGYIHTGIGKTVANAISVTTARATKAKATVGAAARKTVHTRAFVNLRAKAGTSSRVLAVLKPGTALKVTGHKLNHGKRWDHVVYRGHAGWVLAALVR